jgi:hypothetical protein
MQGAIIAILLLLAHHSTAPFDMEHATTVSGVVTEFHWINPHAYIKLDVAEEHWLIEIDSRDALRRSGWTKDTLKPGDRINCTGARAKDPAIFALKCFTVDLPDGRKIPS